MQAHMGQYPSYLGLIENGELDGRVDSLLSLLQSCTVCPRNCKVNRLADARAVCETGRYAAVASWSAHFGEEPCISGRRGSGTVFFAHCNLDCVFCQNYQISQEWKRDCGIMTTEQLAVVYLELQAAGVHNLNWVSPSHVVPQAVEALALAARAGLRLPVVYNSGGYDSASTLRLLDGIVDIYMPDLKFAAETAAADLSKAVGYVPNAHAALQEMWRQVGPLQKDKDGIIRRGLLVRHLVLPNQMSQTEEVLEFLAGQFGKDVAVSLMSQYRPCHEAWQHPEIARQLLPEEYRKALEALERLGLQKGYIQRLG